jgi:hypothetical protein
MKDLHRGCGPGLDLNAGADGSDALFSDVAEVAVLQSPLVDESSATNPGPNDNHCVFSVWVGDDELTT